MFSDGVAQCTRYAFGPNRLHLCGPDMNSEVMAYLKAGVTDAGLTNILKEFKTLYPYLNSIAKVNNIRDPFDKSVVEAYWLGNELLDSIKPNFFYWHLTEKLKLNKKLCFKNFSFLKNKLRQGAKMHHSFHVFNIWKQTGRTTDEQTLKNVDNCRVSVGLVTNINGPLITVLRKPIIIINSQLTFGLEEKKTISRPLEESDAFDNLMKNNRISIHWGIPCEILSEKQAINIEKYTKESLKLANQKV